MDNLKQDAALYAKGGNSSEISQERGKKCHKRTKGSNLSETSQESGKKCHKRTKGSNSCEVSQETENKSGKRQKGISNKRRKTDASEFIQSPTVTQCVSLKTGSTDSSPLSLSGKRKNNDYEADSPPISLSHSSGKLIGLDMQKISA